MPRAIALEQLHVPRPCSADWAAMAGGDRQRFCAACEKYVVDLSAHTRADAEAIVAAALPGGLCAQFCFDAGGRMVTADAPPARRPWWRAGLAVSALVTFVASVIGCRRPAGQVVVGHLSPPATTQTAPLPGEVMIRGDVCEMPTTQPIATPTTQPIMKGAAIVKGGEVAVPPTRPTR